MSVQLRTGHRHLPGNVLRIRVRRPAGIRGRQLHVLGRPGQEENRPDEAPSRAPAGRHNCGDAVQQTAAAADAVVVVPLCAGHVGPPGRLHVGRLVDAARRQRGHHRAAGRAHESDCVSAPPALLCAHDWLQRCGRAAGLCQVSAQLPDLAQLRHQPV